MSLLGDFLEGVYGPAAQFRTIRAVISQWQDRGALDRASAAQSPAGRRKEDSSPQDAAPWETTVQVWVDGPDRVRVEQTRHRDGIVESGLAVVGGGRWWERDYQGHVEEGRTGGRGHRRGPTLTDVERHFSPALLRECFTGLALESQGVVQTTGRDCLRVRAVPRPDSRLWPHWLGFWADEYELHVDPLRGVALFVASKFRGELLETNEVSEVAFDEPLADDLFTYEPRRGEQVRPADTIVEHLTLAAAAARMPFTVLVPTRVVAESARLEVMFHPARVKSPRPHLTLIYFGGNSLHLTQRDTPEPLDHYEWEPVARDGRPMEISDPGPGQRRLVRLEHQGTYVEIRSDLDRDRLIELAASLAPAPRSHAS